MCAVYRVWCGFKIKFQLGCLPLLHFSVLTVFCLNGLLQKACGKDLGDQLLYANMLERATGLKMHSQLQPGSQALERFGTQRTLSHPSLHGQNGQHVQAFQRLSCRCHGYSDLGLKVVPFSSSSFTPGLRNQFVTNQGNSLRMPLKRQACTVSKLQQYRFQFFRGFNYVFHPQSFPCGSRMGNKPELLVKNENVSEMHFAPPTHHFRIAGEKDFRQGGPWKTWIYDGLLACHAQNHAWFGHVLTIPYMKLGIANGPFKKKAEGM